MPVVDLKKCDGCGLCVSVCNNSAIVLGNHSISFLKNKECDWCTLCEAVCPTGAIRCPYEIVTAG
ncbi:MAG: 4Fe-4S binding protein [Chloroflexi bacterium]|nr:4Fe-4S binding protein [Chloroflexota bacterium]